MAIQVIRFGRDHDVDCKFTSPSFICGSVNFHPGMRQDEVLFKLAERVKRKSTHSA